MAVVGKTAIYSFLQQRKNVHKLLYLWYTYPVYAADYRLYFAGGNAILDYAA